MDSNPNNHYLLNSKYRVFYHISFWLAYFMFSGLIHYFGSGFGGFKVFPFIAIVDIVSVYFILFYLMPKFMERKQNLWKFTIFLTITLLVNLTWNFILQNYILGNGVLNLFDCLERQAYNLQLSMVFIFVAIGIKSLKFNIRTSDEINLLEKAKIKSELEFLKNQMNPHFLFNVLNNIYIQTRIEPKKSADMILKLSDLLRYQLYECSQDEVLLKTEVDYLNNYIELQRMRLAKIDIKFEQKGTFKGLMIYPFMFMPFLENAFKHGARSKVKDNFIHVLVEIVEKKVIFVVQNSKIGTSPTQVIKQGGIGLKNIERRLELLYKDNYELKIENEEHYYNVKLKINLK